MTEWLSHIFKILKYFNRKKTFSKSKVVKSTSFGGKPVNIGEIQNDKGNIVFGPRESEIKIDQSVHHHHYNPSDSDQIQQKLISPKVEFKEVFFAKFDSPGSANNGNWGLAFYPIEIINSTPSPFTIKNLYLRFTVDGKTYSEDSVVILTATIYSPLPKQQTNVAIVTMNQAMLNLMNWNNFKVRINELNIINPGGLISGSAYFVLNIKEFEQLKFIKTVELVLADYLGGESVHPIQIENKMIDQSVNMILHNRKETISQFENFHKVSQ